MAEKVAEEIFGEFGWIRVGPVNQNWLCTTEKHERKTHPSDVVFYYDDPYNPERVFWNVDLKSYAAGTITKSKLADAVGALAQSVECANVSAGWQQLYGDDENNWRCDGMLFVYNHDGEFDRSFGSIVDGMDPTLFRLPPKRRLALIGPEDVSYMVNVAHDFVLLRGRKLLPADAAATEFWYPDLVRPKKRTQARSALTIEALTGPWITLHVPPQYNEGRRKYVVYYREKGDTVEEFQYLIDSFFRFQMLAVDGDEIEVRLVQPLPAAVSNFEKAKTRIGTTLYGLAAKRLAPVTCKSVTDVVKRFSELEIGMEPR